LAFLGSGSMSDKDEYLDSESGLRVSGGLAEDLKILFEPASPVPGEVDRAVLDRAREQLVRRGRRRPWPRWAASAAAAAAVIIFAVVLQMQKGTGPDKTAPTPTEARGDVDRNGRVDILDAFKLARHVESAGAVQGEWDMNGDGQVNREDVDIVAFAAVRLDKGV